MLPWLALALGVGFLLAAAKAHGRQVRLEREKAGYPDVVFGGPLPPFVARLWRRDRVRFWTAFPLLALAFVGHLAWRHEGPWAAFAPVAGAALASAAATGLAACGLWSAASARLFDRGSAAWWSLTAALAAATAWALIR